jgi:hypothetical protein
VVLRTKKYSLSEGFHSIYQKKITKNDCFFNTEKRKEKKFKTMNKNCNIMVAHWLYCLNESCVCENVFISAVKKIG